jgi:hypothetical protein
MRLIGLHGLPQSGKDSIGDILCQRHDFARLAFAGPLKDMLIAGLGLTRAEIDGGDKEQVIARFGVTPRYLLQTLGTEWGRGMVRGDLWIAVADQRMKHYRAISASVVITDVRFENEADYVRRQGGEIWHVRRPRSGVVVNLHESNLRLPIAAGIDSVVDNSEGLAQLQDQVALALKGECRVEMLSA